ncbi:MAG: polysaccharide biosynthesis C-terminal domain-containing protein, partial [Proteobacteria bacterium]|nr:polysaccharide biosynthesis C-terminal domain-containing protein [Pseudomonadota bacterium]
LVQFPLALFAVSFSTVLLPSLSRMVTQGKQEGVSAEVSNEVFKEFAKGAHLVFFVTIPAIVGFLVLGGPIVSLLFKQGAFDAAAVDQTTGCLFYLVLGLWAYTGTRLFVTLHYALSSVRRPFVAGLVSIGFNLLLCWFLVTPFGIRGLALSVCLSAMAGFGVLFVNMPGTLSRSHLIVSACRPVFLSVIMFFFVRWAAQFIVTEEYGKLGLGAGIFTCILLGIGCFVLTAVLTASPEIKQIKQMLKKRC